ncbi:MAG: hypothetical protein WCK48_02325 [bacterium]
MQTAFWILGIIYFLIAIVFAVKKTREVFVGSVEWPRRYSCQYYNRRQWWKKQVVPCLGQLALIGVCFLFWATVGLPAWVATIPVRRRQACEVQRRREEDLARNKARAERVAKWRAEHPPVLYYNKNNGVVRVVRKGAYDNAVVERARRVRNGEEPKGCFVFAGNPVILFLHTSAEVRVPEWSAGKLSDFDRLVAGDFGPVVVERRRDILVTFSSGEAEPWMWEPYRQGSDEKRRLEQALQYLLHQDVPPDVLADN